MCVAMGGACPSATEYVGSPCTALTGRRPQAASLALSLAELDLAEPVGVAGPEIGVPPGGRASVCGRVRVRATREIEIDRVEAERGAAPRQ